MVKIIMHGCNGAMGKAVASLVKADKDMAIAAGIDPKDRGENGFPVFPSLDECFVEADLVVDFSTAGAVEGLLDYCVKNKMAVVVCTTGLSPEQVGKVEAAARHIPVLRSANMSLGVNLLLKLVKEAAQVLAAADFDIEILEKHHNQKVDAPSGTALALADAMKEVLDPGYHCICDRSGVKTKREKKEIGIQAIRGGTIVGEHEVIFAGKDEVVTFQHAAYSKAIFAKGAILAAKFLAGKVPGLYGMADVIG